MKNKKILFVSIFLLVFSFFVGLTNAEAADGFDPVTGEYGLLDNAGNITTPDAEESKKKFFDDLFEPVEMAPKSAIPSIGAAKLPSTNCDPGFEKISGVCFPNKYATGLSDAGVLDILANILSWMFALFTILSIMAFIVSGIQYLVSTGDTGMIETAKRNTKWSVVGIIVGLSGFLILKAVSAALSGSAIF